MVNLVLFPVTDNTVRFELQKVLKWITIKISVKKQ